MSVPVSRSSRSRKPSRTPSVDAQVDIMLEIATNLEEEPSKQNFWEDIREDWHNVAVLLLLYTLQGIPMGLAMLIPMLLTEKGVGLSDLGTFSLNVFPYSIKLLWAPIVDSVFSNSMGRRKTWLVPSQLLIGCLLVIAPLDHWINELQISSLTWLFVVLYFCAATQDIAVDGWALEMLSRKNVSLASPCNTAGQTLGMFLSSSGYMLLSYYELVTLDTFSCGAGVCFISVTVGIWIFKSESPPEDIEDLEGSYRLMFKMLKLPAIRSVITQFIFAKVPFALSSIAILKIQEGGVPKEQLASIGTMITIISIILPAVSANWLHKSDGMILYDRLYVPRLLIGPFVVMLTHLAPAFSKSNYFLLAITGWQLCESLLGTAQFLAQISFFNKVSDPIYGGTYMTFLNTVGNIAALWPITAGLKSCSYMGFGTYSFIVLTFGTVWYITVGKRGFMRLASLQPGDWVVQ